MKSKRRHELQENVLSGELAGIVTFLKNHGVKIVWAVLIVAGIILATYMVYNRSVGKKQRLQSEFDRAISDTRTTPDERVELLKGLAGQDDDERIAAEACIRLGDEYLRRMMIAGTSDPQERKSLGDEAARWYNEVIQRLSGRRLQLAKAHLGLGRLAGNRGDVETARSQYDAVIRMTDLSGQPVVQRASSSIQKLGQIDQPVPMATTAPAIPVEDEPVTSDTAPVTSDTAPAAPAAAEAAPATAPAGEQAESAKE